VGVRVSDPPQLRMFMRITLHPAAQARMAMPWMYCESDEPSSPWTSTTVSRPAPAWPSCQWQWQSTWLPSAGSTSTVSACLQQEGRPRKKVSNNCCRWPFASRVSAQTATATPPAGKLHLFAEIGVTKTRQRCRLEKS